MQFQSEIIKLGFDRSGLGVAVATDGNIGFVDNGLVVNAHSGATINAAVFHPLGG